MKILVIPNIHVYPESAKLLQRKLCDAGNDCDVINYIGDGEAITNVSDLLRSNAFNIKLFLYGKRNEYDIIICFSDATDVMLRVLDLMEYDGRLIFVEPMYKRKWYKLHALSKALKYSLREVKKYKAIGKTDQNVMSPMLLLKYQYQLRISSYNLKHDVKTSTVAIVSEKNRCVTNGNFNELTDKFKKIRVYNIETDDVLDEGSEICQNIILEVLNANI